MSENALWRTDEIGTPRLLSGQSNDNGGRVCQSDLSSDGGPATKRRTLESKKEEDATKEAFNSTALAHDDMRGVGQMPDFLWVSAL
jgi:hypothetical protein